MFCRIRSLSKKFTEELPKASRVLEKELNSFIMIITIVIMIDDKDDEMMREVILNQVD